MTHPDLFDRSLLASRRARALKSAVKGADFLLANVAHDLAERLEGINRHFATALDMGGHTGLIYRMLQNSQKTSKILRADIFTPDPNLAAPDLVLDDSLPPLGKEKFNLIVSALSLQWVNDLPGTLVQIRQSLLPDGLFLAVLPGANTLHELRDVLMRAEMEYRGGASPRVIPFADTRDMGALLQRAGFALPVADMDRLVIRYDTMFNLMADLKAMGATSILSERSRKPLPYSVFLRAAELYAQDYSDQDGRIRASFSLITLSGWAPHESQQKPLKPGSAKLSLAEALKSEKR